MTGKTRPYLDQGVRKVYRVPLRPCRARQDNQVMTATTRPYRGRLVLGGSKAQRVTTATMATMGHGVRQVLGVPPRLWLDRLVLGVLRAMMGTMAHEDR